MDEQQPRRSDSREKVLAAAAAMMAEDPAARLSVRAVAARAGVSTGSLRFHFPTQQELQDTLLARIFDYLTPDDPIHDSTLSAHDRLVACLRQVLAPAGVGDQARAAWGKAWKAFIEPEQTDDVRHAYVAIERESLRRIIYWLDVLRDEGALHHGDHAQLARFLMTVLSGISIERALPAEGSKLHDETATLHTAVAAVLGPAPTTTDDPA